MASPATDGSISKMDYINTSSVKKLSEEDNTIVGRLPPRDQVPPDQCMFTDSLEEFSSFIRFCNPDYRPNGLPISLWVRFKTNKFDTEVKL